MSGNVSQRSVFHFAAASQSRRPALVGELRDRVARVRAARPGGLISVDLLVPLDRDPLADGPHYRPTVDLRTRESADAAELAAPWFDELRGLIDTHACTALAGNDFFYLSGARTPLRYQRLMHRDASHTHESFLAYYRDTHSRYGIATPGIENYVQFHIDLSQSARLAKRTGAGLWDVDGVSELHILSVEGFMEALAASPVGGEALDDEKRFADVHRSTGFLSSVDFDPAGGR